MTQRLIDLEVQEVSLVDDPAVPEARYLITKAKSRTPDNPVTDTNTEAAEPTLLERIGKSVMDMLGAAPADETTRRILVSSIAKAAEADDEAEESEEPAEDEAEKSADEPEAEAAEDEAEKSADAEADASEEPAEKRKKCPSCGRFTGSTQRHRDADNKEKAAEAEEMAEEEAEKSADEPEAETEDPNAALLTAFKSMLDAELTPLREAIGKAATAENVSEIGERVEALEKRKGVSKAAKGSDLESDEADSEGTFGNVIFGGF